MDQGNVATKSISSLRGKKQRQSRVRINQKFKSRVRRSITNSSDKVSIVRNEVSVLPFTETGEASSNALSVMEVVDAAPQGVSNRAKESEDLKKNQSNIILDCVFSSDEEEETEEFKFEIVDEIAISDDCNEGVARKPDHIISKDVFPSLSTSAASSEIKSMNAKKDNLETLKETVDSGDAPLANVNKTSCETTASCSEEIPLDLKAITQSILVSNTDSKEIKKRNSDKDTASSEEASVNPEKDLDDNKMNEKSVASSSVISDVTPDETVCHDNSHFEEQNHTKLIQNNDLQTLSNIYENVENNTDESASRKQSKNVDARLYVCNKDSAAVGALTSTTDDIVLKVDMHNKDEKESTVPDKKICVSGDDSASVQSLTDENNLSTVMNDPEDQMDSIIEGVLSDENASGTEPCFGAKMKLMESLSGNITEASTPKNKDVKREDLLHESLETLDEEIGHLLEDISSDESVNIDNVDSDFKSRKEEVCIKEEHKNNKFDEDKMPDVSIEPDEEIDSLLEGILSDGDSDVADNEMPIKSSLRSEESSLSNTVTITDNKKLQEPKMKPQSTARQTSSQELSEITDVLKVADDELDCLLEGISSDECVKSEDSEEIDIALEGIDSEDNDGILDRSKDNEEPNLMDDLPDNSSFKDGIDIESVFLDDNDDDTFDQVEKIMKEKSNSNKATEAIQKESSDGFGNKVTDDEDPHNDFEASVIDGEEKTACDSYPEADLRDASSEFMSDKEESYLSTEVIANDTNIEKEVKSILHVVCNIVCLQADQMLTSERIAVMESVLHKDKLPPPNVSLIIPVVTTVVLSEDHDGDQHPSHVIQKRSADDSEIELPLLKKIKLDTKLPDDSADVEMCELENEESTLPDQATAQCFSAESEISNDDPSLSNDIEEISSIATATSQSPDEDDSENLSIKENGIGEETSDDKISPAITIDIDIAENTNGSANETKGSNENSCSSEKSNQEDLAGTSQNAFSPNAPVEVPPLENPPNDGDELEDHVNPPEQNSETLPQNSDSDEDMETATTEFLSMSKEAFYSDMDLNDEEQLILEDLFSESRHLGSESMPNGVPPTNPDTVSEIVNGNCAGVSASNVLQVEQEEKYVDVRVGDFDTFIRSKVQAFCDFKYGAKVEKLHDQMDVMKQQLADQVKYSDQVGSKLREMVSEQNAIFYQHGYNPKVVKRTVGVNVRIIQQSEQRLTAPGPSSAPALQMNHQVRSSSSVPSRPLSVPPQQMDYQVRPSSSVPSARPLSVPPQSVNPLQSRVQTVVGSTSSLSNSLAVSSTTTTGSMYSNGCLPSANKPSVSSSATIHQIVDLTDDDDDDDDPPSPPASSNTAQVLAATSSTSSNSRAVPIATSLPSTSNTTPNSSLPPNSQLTLTRCFNKHPAPLPQPPVYQSNPRFKALPPQPSLKMNTVANGIVLSWNMSITSNTAEISTYQLYAYQETNGPVSQLLWKKVGDIKALPLPMACTLTQFVEGNKYHFTVRAVDVHKRIGPFSEPVLLFIRPKNGEHHNSKPPQ